MGKTGMSEVEEINAVEEIEGDNVYETNYIIGVEATIGLQSRPRRPDSIPRRKENPKKERYESRESHEYSVLINT